MFINFTNHPSEKWSAEQLADAAKYGEIMDIPFPTVDVYLTKPQIQKMAAQYADDIAKLSPAAVLCQGEMTLTYAVVSLLKAKGITVLCACTEREVTQLLTVGGDTVKKSVFTFACFREY